MVRVSEKDHFIGQSIHLVTRLRDHISRLDGGALYAADDIAVVLRAFIHRSRGNDVLGRLVSMSGAEAPNCTVSRAPKTGTHFSAGSIPTVAEAVVDGARQIPVTKLGSQQALVIRINGKEIRYDWALFLNDYANKWGGAHIDRDVPQHLQTIDIYAVSNFNLSTYLLRAVAVEVWQAVQKILATLMSFFSQIPQAGPSQTAIYAAPGGISEFPPDRFDAGELQWLDYETEATGFLIYATGSCAIRISIGGAYAHTINCMAEHDAIPLKPIQEVRIYDSPPVLAANFSKKRMMQVNGRVCPPPVDAERIA